MSKTRRDLGTFSWGKFIWTEIICVKKLTFCNSGKQPLIAQHWPVWWHVFTAQVKNITWKLEAVPGPRILIYTITIKLTDMARAPITFTCSPQVRVDPFTRSNQNFKSTRSSAATLRTCTTSLPPSKVLSTGFYSSPFSILATILICLFIFQQ